MRAAISWEGVSLRRGAKEGKEQEVAAEEAKGAHLSHVIERPKKKGVGGKERKPIGSKC